MRMIRKAVCTAVLAVAASALPAAAQISLSAAGGPTFAMGDFGDAVDTGFNGQVSATLSVPLLPIGVRVDGMFNQFPVTGSDADLRILSGSVNGILSMPSIGITPYLIGGLGIYNVDGGILDDDTSTDVGANVGVGVRVGLPGLAVFGEARLHNIFSEGDATRFAPVSVGLRF